MLKQGFNPLFILWIFSSCQSNQLKPGVCLSFDDNHLEQWVEILPLLDKYEAKATFFLTGVGKLSEQEKVWLKQIQEAGHEIGAHGELHVSAHQFIQEHGYRKFLTEEIKDNIWALKNLGVSPVFFAYPFGERNKLMDLMLWTKFKATRNVASINSSSEILEKQVLKSQASFHYHSLSIDAGELGSLEQIRTLMEKAKKEQQVLFLHAHGIGESGDYHVSNDRLDSLLRMGKAKGLDFIAFRDL